jgi:hypothetical protein
MGEITTLVTLPFWRVATITNESPTDRPTFKKGSAGKAMAFPSKKTTPTRLAPL